MIYTSPPVGVQSIAISISMSVCLHTQTTCPNFTKFSIQSCYLWLWVDPLLTIMKYIMYFWFCGWGHVCT